MTEEAPVFSAPTVILRQTSVHFFDFSLAIHLECAILSQNRKFQAQFLCFFSVNSLENVLESL